MTKSAAEGDRMHSDYYDEYAIGKTTCGDWFHCFNNSDINGEAWHSGG